MDRNTSDAVSIVGGVGVGMQQCHVFSPFFSGQDDRLLVELVVQVGANPRMRGAVVGKTEYNLSRKDNWLVPRLSTLVISIAK